MDVGQMVNKLEAIRAGLERLKAEEQEVAAALAAAAPALAAYANGKRPAASGLVPYDHGLSERIREYVRHSTGPFRYMDLCRGVDGKSDSVGRILHQEVLAGRAVKISRGLYRKPDGE